MCKCNSVSKKTEQESECVCLKDKKRKKKKTSFKAFLSILNPENVLKQEKKAV